MDPVDSLTQRPVADAQQASLQGQRPEKPEDVRRAIKEAASQINMGNPSNPTKTGLPVPKALEKMLGWRPAYVQAKAALESQELTHVYR